MEKNIKKYIDGIIRTCAYEVTKDSGYTLYVDDFSPTQQKIAINYLLNNSETIKTILLDHLQSLINERLDLVYAEDKKDKGYVPVVDKVNGEIRWEYMQ